MTKFWRIDGKQKEMKDISPLSKNTLQRRKEIKSRNDNHDERG